MKTKTRYFWRNAENPQWTYVGDYSGIIEDCVDWLQSAATWPRAGAEYTLIEYQAGGPPQRVRTIRLVNPVARLVVENL